MRKGMKTTKVVYGIRHKSDPWMFVDSKQDRDFLWENVSRYPHVAVDWEICEKTLILTAPMPIAPVELAVAA